MFAFLSYFQAFKNNKLTSVKKKKQQQHKRNKEVFSILSFYGKNNPGNPNKSHFILCIGTRGDIITFVNLSEQTDSGSQYYFSFVLHSHMYWVQDCTG